MVEQFAALLVMASEGLVKNTVTAPGSRLFGGAGAAVARQSGSPGLERGVRVRHSGRARLLRGALGALAAGLLAAVSLPGQAPQRLALDLRSGRSLEVDGLVGSPEAGFTVRIGGRTERVAADELLAIRGGAAAAPPLMRVELVGGDRLFGAISGGDEDGDFLELLSPVLGKQRVAVDRLAAAVRPGVHPGDQVVPDGVDEVLFVPTARGFDLVAGTLYRFGSEGVQFQPEGRDAPAWYAADKISALRLRGGFAREGASPCTLLTRTADRLGVSLVRCTADGVEVALEDGVVVAVRWLDVACLVFDGGVTHLSALQPLEVVERGYAGGPVLGWQRDRCAAGGELVAQRRAYGRGLGVHGLCRLTFEAPPTAARFRAAVAFDDSAAALPIQPHAVARVRRNGELTFEAVDLRPGQAPRAVGPFDVEPGDKIVLEVDFGEGRDLGDRVDWLLPMFLQKRGS